MGIDVIEQILSNVPEDWEAGEESAESVCVAYVRALEKRVKTLDGHRSAHDGGQTAALGDFYRCARLHVTMDSCDSWNDLVDAWETYHRIKREAR